MSILYHHTLGNVVEKETNLLLPKILRIYEKFEKLVIGG